MLRACLAAVAALLLLACTARAQSETVNFASLVGPDFSSRSLLAQFMPRPVGATAGGNAVIQPITLTPPSCPAGAFKCYNLTNSALTSLGIVVNNATGTVLLAVYSDVGNQPGALLGQVTVSNLQFTTSTNSIRINEVNFTAPIPVSFTVPTRFWVAFIVPSGSPAAPLYFLDGTSCPNYGANVASFPASAPNTVFNVPCDNSTVFLAFLGYRASIPLTPPALPFNPYFVSSSPSNPTPTGLYSVQKCPKGALCASLASAGRTLAASALVVLLFTLIMLLH